MFVTINRLTSSLAEAECRIISFFKICSFAIMFKTSINLFFMQTSVVRDLLCHGVDKSHANMICVLIGPKLEHVYVV